MYTLFLKRKRCSNVLQTTSVDSLHFESIKLFSVKIDWNCNFVDLLHQPFLALACFGTFWTSLFNILNYIFAKEHRRGFCNRNAHMVQIVN